MFQCLQGKRGVWFMEEEPKVCFVFFSVRRGFQEMERAAVNRTSAAHAVSTAPPPTNMDQTVTEVSLTHTL